MKSPVEDLRLQTLRDTGLLDAVSVPSLDRLTALAARLLGAHASVTLIGADQRYVVSCSGAGDFPRTGNRADTYCSFVVQDEAPVIVVDARVDPRLRDIADPGALGYAGFPLRAPNGSVLGALCAVDSEPRDWSADDLACLGDLAEIAATEVTLRLTCARETAANQRVEAVLRGTHDAFITTDRSGRVLSWNAAAERMFGHSARDAAGRMLAELIVPEQFRNLPCVRDQPIRVTLAGSTGQEFPAEMTLQDHDDVLYYAFAPDTAFLQALLDSLDTGVAACDSEGRLTFFNRSLRQMLGGDADPTLPMDEWSQHYKVYKPDGRTVMDLGPLARAQAGEVVRGEQVLVWRDDEWRRLVSNARPIDAPDGRRLGAVAVTRDITEAHRAEELRRARHAVAQVLSDATNARDASIQAVAAITDELGWLCGEYWQVTDDRKRIVRHSSHAPGDRDLSAFTNEQPLDFVIGEGLPGLVWSRNGEVWWNTGIMPEDMVSYGRRELQLVGIRVAVGVPVRSGRRVLGVLAFYTDADLPYDSDTAGMLDAVGAHLGQFLERRWAEDMSLALAAARRSFNRVVEQVNDYVWTVEVDNDGPPRLHYGSPNAYGVFGPVPDGVQPTLTDRLHPDDAELLTAFQAELLDGTQAELECRIIGYDGQTRWIWTRAMARWENDAFLVDGLSTDVTERRELANKREELLEQERLQVEQLRTLDRMKDELAAMVIHELRNPVGVIRAYTEELIDSVSLADADRRHAGVIERTTLHLQGLVDDLLDLARLAAGHISIDPRPIGGGRLVRDVIENHTPSAAAKRLTVVDAVQPEFTVHADGQRLRQALDNLLSNAIKYTPDGGTVTVAASVRDDEVVIEISDNGIGIPAEQYPHLFSRFFRASNATRAGIKGTGLGLAVTKAIVEAHGGTIAAGPAPDGGTRFTIVLPA
ncbi:PAS domain-containing sensor histidine kinase [Paractinoplanes toevensis]|uniref:PAS domain-containing sensor histidine kinase n=1 Tax=Paractinoplanes toevensis TaxID=571911 RepID=UPI001BB41AC8|nr:ATP-binding protein [Actinoplanes toevensis]